MGHSGSFCYVSISHGVILGPDATDSAVMVVAFGTDLTSHGALLGARSLYDTIMSTTRKRLSRIEDLTLGAFGNLQPSETLNHLIRYLSTWNGSECVFSPFFPFDFESILNGNV